MSDLRERQLARLTRPGRVDGLPGAFGGRHLLRARGPWRRRPQFEIGRDRQRRARFDGELVRARLIKPDQLPKTAAGQQRDGTERSNRE